MLDTVIISLPGHAFTDMKGKQPWLLQSCSPGFSKHVRNPTAADKKAGLYLPRLSWIRRGNTGHLKIEFSAPKLLFDNNVDELAEEQFEELISILCDRLYHMGIIAYSKDLEKAEITAFHPSKNILLTDGYTASMILADLGKVNANKRLDSAKVTFRNEGQSVQYWAKAHSLVFYNKIADLKQPKCRAIDKDRTASQISIFDQLTATRAPEILRMEVRLCNKRKSKQVLENIGYMEKPTLSSIFNTDLNKKILQIYWNEFITNDFGFLLNPMTAPQMLLKQLLKQGMKPKEAITLVGLDQLSRDSPGVRGLRNTVEAVATKRSWNRYANHLKQLNGYQKSQGWQKQIETGLRDMTPLKISESLTKSGYLDCKAK